MEMNYAIYGLVDSREPERVRYIGQTTQTVRKRLFGHWKTTNREDKPRYPVHKWMKKRERDQIQAVVLRQCMDFDSLCEAEIQLIAEYRAIGQADLNLCSGGAGAPGRKHSEEFKEKMRAKVGPLNGNYGKKMPEHVRQAIILGDQRKTPEQRIAHAESVAKLTPKDVGTMRWLYEADMFTVKQLAHQYGVSNGNVWNIVKYKTWKHVGHRPL